ncbi:MAG: methyltransferase domain-containing protein [Candidatus Paceibacterota bacterium]
MEFMTLNLNIFPRFFREKAGRVLKVLRRTKRKIAGDRYNMERHQHKIIRSTRNYDMSASLDEHYYQEQYWHWIEKYLNSGKLSKNGRYLDLGCGQGRLSILLAKWCTTGGKVIGVDFSKEAIGRARRYTDEASLHNIDYYTADILSFLKENDDNSFDGVLLLEVIFYLPNYHLVLEEVKRVLKPGGLLFASFRSQYFNILYNINKRNWNDINTVFKNRIGRLGDGDVYFTWQTSDEIAYIIGKELKFKVLDLCGIGCCSGIEGDPHACIAKPACLNKDKRDVLMKLEIDLANAVPDAGRYILCTAQKK